VEYLWTSCTEPVSAQSDLYRLTYAIEQLKSQGWGNAVVSDDEWDYGLLAEEYRGTDALLVKKTGLTRGFSDEGKLLAPVEFIATGDCSACMAVFLAHALPVAMPEPGRIALNASSLGCPHVADEDITNITVY